MFGDKMKSTNILLLSPNKADATSFYRGWGPFSELRRNYGGELNIIPGDGLVINWATLSMVDIVFMQRPYNSSHLELAKMANMNGVPLWVDYDDDLFCVPQDNPAHDIYNESAQKNIAEIITRSDAVSVSTQTLKDKIEKLNKNIHVVKNSLNFNLLDNIQKKSEKSGRNLLALWRGSNTHFRDLASYSSAIAGAIKKTGSYAFIGSNPWHITSLLNESERKRVAIYKGVDLIEYHNAINALRPLFAHIPLHRCEFNMSKSNIAFLEAAWTGAPSIVPDMPEWLGLDGSYVYSNEDQYLELMIHLFHNPDEAEKRGHLARKFVRSEYDLKRWNLKRVELIKGLL